MTQTAISCPRSFDQFDFFNDPVFQASSWPMFNENNPVYATSRLTTPFSFPDMGPAAFQDAVAKGPILASCSYGQLRRTNSVFSDHFNAVEYFLQQKLTSSEASWDTRDES